MYNTGVDEKKGRGLDGMGGDCGPANKASGWLGFHTTEYVNGQTKSPARPGMLRDSRD